MSSAAAQRILILSSSTGGGHDSAAHALNESFAALAQGLRTPVDVTTSWVLEESTQFSRSLADTYNYLLRHNQAAMKYFYWTINALKPNEWPMVLNMAKGYGQRLILEHAPSVVVSVHPMVQHFMAYVLRKLGLAHRIPLITVVTDPGYGFWQGWASPDVSHYYVASQGAKQQLLDYGIAPDRISIEGMPVHSSFSPLAQPQQRQALLHSFGLDPNKLTLLINAGWIGGGNIPHLANAVMQASGLTGWQILYVTGQNHALYQQAQACLAQHPHGLQGAILSHPVPMVQAMQASHVMLSKMGGLTTFEAMATGLPIWGDAVTPPMPQEASTAHWLAEQGYGQLIHSPEALLTLMRQWQADPSLAQAMQAKVLASPMQGATQRIAQAILRQLPAAQPQLVAS